MSYTAQDIHDLISKIRYDCTAIQAKVTELKTALASFDLPEEDPGLPCPFCGVRRPNERLLAEHEENVHGKVAA